LQADLVLFNGRLYTMDERLPLAGAVAARDGRIVAVGDDAEVLALAGPDTERWNLCGRTILPGFTDAHMHLVSYGLSLTQVQLNGLTSRQEAVARVAERACVTEPGEWIRGWGWNRNLWPGTRFPSRRDLDPVTPHNPVYLVSKDGHAAWVNSLALERAGVTRETPDPPGAQFERDSSTGELTGVLKEGAALGMIEEAAGPVSLERKKEAITRAAQRLHSLGIVGVHTPEQAHDLTALQEVWLSGELDLRVNVMIAHDYLENALQMGLRGGLGDEFLRLGAIKVFADGSLGTRSADMFAPYEGELHNKGIEVTGSERMRQLVADCTAGGWNVAIHAIGDRANCRVLDALEEYWREWSHRGLRPRIEHVQLVSPQDMPRLATMGVIASMQPIHCTSDMIMAERHWGARCSGAYAWRSLLESGAVLAFGSDAPVEDPNVLQGLFAAATRQHEDGTPPGGWYPEQCLSVPQAVYAYTLGAAFASGEERIKGSLTVGKQADMVVLSQDIFAVPVQEILGTRVEATILAGEAVYRPV
jgi:predicted amidohydrolase YtcJ